MNDLAATNKLGFREKITLAEKVLGMAEQADLPLTHHFSKGLYARQMHIPAGVVLTGKIHKTEHLCVVHGDIKIESEDGVKRFTGFHIFKSKPGAKRLGLALADTEFTTFHATDETDISTLEEELVVDTFQNYDAFLLEQQKKLEAT